MMSKNNRNSSYTGRKSWVKYAGLTVALAVICTVAFFALLKTDVFGKFEAVEPYVVEGTVKDHVDQIVTDEGDNYKGGGRGTEAKPCSDEVPTCIGEKGSKTNPFVVLEIVPDNSQQQLAYLGQDEDNVGPLDIMKIGIDFSQEKNRGLSDMDTGVFMNFLAGTWFFSGEYKVYKIGTEEKESLPFAYVDKEFYTLEFNDNSINEKMGNNSAAEKFAEIFENTSGQDRMNKLSEEFPALFEKDKNNKEIRNDKAVNVLKDSRNWKISHDVVVTPEESEKFKAPGYMVMVEPGNGQYGFASLEDAKNWRFSKTGTDADRWVYVEDEAAMEQNQKYAEYLEKYDVTGGIWSNGFYYPDEKGDKGPWHNGLQDLYNDQENPQFTGLIYKIDSGVTCRYVKTPEKKEHKYKFVYSALRNNNILKRALFTFERQKEYDDFHMKVISMTPAELNIISQNDTPETVDMIERADMYYIQSGMNYKGEAGVDNVGNLQKFYDAYVAEIDAEHKNDTFYENDLEWSLCQKIIQRQAKIGTLPLVFNQMVPSMLEGGITRDVGNKEVHMYLTKYGNDKSKESDNGSRNNISKLYLIMYQFDLLTNDSEFKYERTFMEDIYPYIKTIDIPKNEKGAVEGTATTTAYYDYNGYRNNPKKLCECGEKTDEFEQRVYYLWNGYTFLLQDMEIDMATITEESKQKLLEQGYLPAIVDGNNVTQPFQSDHLSHHSASDGTDNKNVTIVSAGSNSNTNQSTFLGSSGSLGITSDMLGVVYLILNNRTTKVQPVTVKVEAQKKIYVKLTEDTVMIDYEDDGKKSPTDKDLYVKVRIKNNGNNRPGQVRKITLNNSKGEPSKELKLYTDKACKTEYSKMWKREEGDSVEWYKGIPEEGYSVPKDNGYIVGYVKFTLNEWKTGYNELSFDTIGWAYIPPKGKVGEGRLTLAENTTPISIIGKTLFDLE